LKLIYPSFLLFSNFLQKSLFYENKQGKISESMKTQYDKEVRKGKACPRAKKTRTKTIKRRLDIF